MIRCLAIDDEPLALTQITAYIRKIPFLELVGSCHDALHAIELMAHHEVDAIFVDINMPDLNGLDFVRSLSEKPLIVFTTAYSEYAVCGFKVDAIDYLLKPFSYNDLLRSANKIRYQFELIHASGGVAASGVFSDGAEEPEDRHMFVKSDYKIVKIEYDDIRYIESQSEYVKIYMVNQSPVMTLLSLKAMEEQLPDSQFMRTHRSYIVNLKKITEISRAGIGLDKQTVLPVGEQYREKLNGYIDRYLLFKH